MSLLRLFSVLCLLIPTGASAGAAITPGSARVAFHADGHPGVLSVDGVSTELGVTDDGTTLFFHVSLATVGTGIELRDLHMLEQFAPAFKPPHAVLQVPRLGVRPPRDMGQTLTGTTFGSFVTNGVAQPVEVQYVATRSQRGIRVYGRFDFDLRKHGFALPSYLGTTLDPAMSADATFELVGVE